MSLAIGTTLGVYEVLSLLGAGGMGEVYRARDTKLNRDVAIKVLPEAFALDADRLARFTREAQVLASLNHPNIAAIYGIEGNALVMELVEGEDLSTIIARGPMALADALPIARQIAEALEAAHEQGIVHRDLKPANVKVRPDGTVKVLDFGLAKALDQGSGIGDQGSGGAANSPTITTPAMTMRGMILGTAAYMSPEQAKGRAVDKRADIWAFGVVLYEMLTGARAFHGEDITDTIVAVVSKEPDWTRIPVATPARLRQLLRRCLQKDAKVRLRDIGEARVELSALIGGAPEPDEALTPVRSRRRSMAWLVVGAALGAAAILLTAPWWRVTPEPAPVVSATIEAPDGHILGEGDFFLALPSRTPMVFTADGAGLIILATLDPIASQSVRQETRSRLFFRSLDRPEMRPIAGTEGARTPFVSPDGKWVGFWASNELRKVPIEGGTPVTICPLATPTLGPFGVMWGPGDVIVFGDVSSGRIMRVSANGGTPVAVTAQPPVSSRRRHIAPSLLADGRRILYSDTSTQDAADSRIMVQSLDGGTATLVIDQATDGRLLPSGQLAFIRLATLMTVSFDAGRGVATGEPNIVMNNVMQGGMIRRAGVSNPGMAMFAVSKQGTLVAIRGGLAGVTTNTIGWLDARGQTSAEPAQGAPPGRRMNLRISPDRSRALVTVFAPRRQEMWLADWTRNVWTACDNCDTELGVGVWSPNGRHLLLGRDGALIEHALDGSSPDRVLLRETDRAVLPIAWLDDGRIVYMSSPDLANYDVRLLLAGATEAQVVLELGVGGQPDVSPNGRWLAYRDVRKQKGDPNDFRDSNVIVQAFPGPGARLQVSAGGGAAPIWSRDSKTLYFMGSSQQLLAVDIASTGGLSASSPRAVMGNTGNCFPSRCADLVEGPRFLFPVDPTEQPASITRMDLVLNWTSTLQRDLAAVQVRPQ